MPDAPFYIPIRITKLTVRIMLQELRCQLDSSEFEVHCGMGSIQDFKNPVLLRISVKLCKGLREKCFVRFQADQHAGYELK